MADCLTHGGHAAAEYAVLVRLLSGGRWLWLTIVAYVYGFVEGAWPDVSGAIKAIGMPDGPEIERWPVIFGLKVRMHVPTYNKYHFEYKGKWWSWLLGLRTHVKYVDPDFHAAGPGWFPREWMRYFAMIIIAIVGFGFAFF